MIERLSHLLARRNVAAVVVGVVLLLAAGGLSLSLSLKHDDDILAFLPDDDPHVQVFHQLNKRFGGLDVALVGLQAPNGKEIFEPDFLTRIFSLTGELDDTNGLDRVLSVTNLVDFTPDLQRGGIITAPLVGSVPRTKEALAKLRAKIMSRDHVVGNLVSADARAALVYCFLAHDSDTKAVATRIRKVVERSFPTGSAAKFYGGGPFISTYIFGSTQRDMRRLTPWAVLAMVLVMMIAFRDFRGTCLALLSTSIGIVLSLGLMRLCGVQINLALGSMPVILFAVGSAYGIHILSRYYALSQHLDREMALAATLRTAGPTVLAAGLTTVISLLSFITMDLRPMRDFGLFTAIGVFASLLLALTFIPAVIRLTRLGNKRPRSSEALSQRVLVGVVGFARRRRVVVGVALGLLAAFGLALTMRVSAQIEMSNLFAANSPVDRAERFLQQRFGGSQFLWIHVAGDMTDPHVLREVQLIGDRAALLPHVTSVMHVGDALSRANEAMEGLGRLPDTKDKARLLYAMLGGDPSIGQLVSGDLHHALIQVKLSSGRAKVREAVLDAVEGSIARKPLRRYQLASIKGSVGAARQRQLLLARLQAIAHKASFRVDPERVEGELERLQQQERSSNDPALRDAVATMARTFLRSEECVVEVPASKQGLDPAKRVAEAVAAVGPQPSVAALEQALTALSADWLTAQNEQVTDLAVNLQTPLSEMWKRARSHSDASALIAAAKLPASLKTPVATALLELDTPKVFRPLTEGEPAVAATSRSLRVDINGLPVLHRSLSYSALSNQIKSLSAALLPVIIIMIVLFRSVRTGLLVASPTMLTLLVIYGGMGLLEVQLDLGTALLACIILGAGVDYAVHFAAGWRGDTVDAAAERAARTTGGAIWTNALTVAIGFGVLTLGEARPLQNVGGLTAVAMLVAAVTTFLLIPVLARRNRYAHSIKEPDEMTLDDPADETAALDALSSASGRNQ